MVRWSMPYRPKEDSRACDKFSRWADRVRAWVTVNITGDIVARASVCVVMWSIVLASHAHVQCWWIVGVGVFLGALLWTVDEKSKDWGVVILANTAALSMLLAIIQVM